MGAGVSTDREGVSVVLRRRQDLVSGTIALSPGEGFLWSRIDGVTPWRQLREMGGLPADEVDLCLESWLAQGLIERVEKAVSRQGPWPRIGASRPSGRSGIDPGDLDDSLDLPRQAQLRILEFEQRLSSGPHHLLGVEAEADAGTVKSAYRTLSREFHPDRYFRRQIGSYEKRLHRVFKGVVSAYRELTGPRAALDRPSLAPVGVTPRGGDGGAEVRRQPSSSEEIG